MPNSFLPPISLYKVNRGFVNQQILKMSSKKSWKGQMTSSALFNAADIFDWKFSFPTSSTKPAFSMTCMGCSLTWENTSVIPLLSQVFTRFWSAFMAVPQFAKLKGHSYLDGQYLSLSCADFAEMYTGHHLWNNYRVTAVLKPVTGTEHFVNIRVQGALRSYAAGFSGNNKLVLRNNWKGVGSTWISK